MCVGKRESYFGSSVTSSTNSTLNALFICVNNTNVTVLYILFHRNCTKHNFIIYELYYITARLH